MRRGALSWVHRCNQWLLTTRVRTNLKTHTGEKLMCHRCNHLHKPASMIFILISPAWWLWWYHSRTSKVWKKILPLILVVASKQHLCTYIAMLVYLGWVSFPGGALIVRQEQSATQLLYCGATWSDPPIQLGNLARCDPPAPACRWVATLLFTMQICMQETCQSGQPARIGWIASAPAT